MDDLEKRELFLNKQCVLEKRGSFYLFGIVLDVTFGPGGGVVFKTEQLTSFISWEEIVTLIPKEKAMRGNSSVLTNSYGNPYAEEKCGESGHRQRREMK